jgi:predicted CopG family antitoxin
MSRKSLARRHRDAEESVLVSFSAPLRLCGRKKSGSAQFLLRVTSMTWPIILIPVRITAKIEPQNNQYFAYSRRGLCLDRIPGLCIVLCMATKTLSVDEEAYRKLVRAKLHRGESFSKVIRRAKWDDGPRRCGDLLARATGEISEAALRHLSEAQEQDRPPADKWNR